MDTPRRTQLRDRLHRSPLVPQARRTQRLLLSLLAVVALFTAAACGGGGDGDELGEQSPGGAEDRGPAFPMRIAMAPDPVFALMESAGLVAAWEEKYNTTLEIAPVFDAAQVSAQFNGGRVDLMMVDAVDVPTIATQGDRVPVIIGKFTTDRTIVAVNRTARNVQTFQDLIEQTIAVDRALGSTLIWGVIAESLYGLELREGGDDFNLVVTEGSPADLVERGEADACICRPESSINHLAQERLRLLYDERSASQVYAEEVLGSSQRLPTALTLVADKKWHSDNAGAADALLELLQLGVDTWQINKRATVQEFPNLMMVQTENEITWISEYLNVRDWISPSVYLTEDDEAIYADLYSRMAAAELIPNDATQPEIYLAQPPSP